MLRSESSLILVTDENVPLFAFFPSNLIDFVRIVESESASAPEVQVFIQITE